MSFLPASKDVTHQGNAQRGSSIPAWRAGCAHPVAPDAQTLVLSCAQDPVPAFPEATVCRELLVVLSVRAQVKSK